MTNKQIDMPTPKQHTPMPFLARLLVGACLVFVLLLIVLYVAAGTRVGTVFVLNKISAETGMKIEYEQGTLKDGLKVTRIEMHPTDKITVLVDNANIKMGWRALLSKQVHLTNTHIDSIAIHDENVPTGEPFDYTTIATPVQLHLNDTTIGQIVYKQTTVSPLVMHDIEVKKAVWHHANIELTDGSIGIDDEVFVRSVNGKIRLAEDYPLDATANVEIKALNEHFIDSFDVKAVGSLRRTTGQVSGFYNKFPVSGRFAVQSLDDGVPFWADLSTANMVLPYAQSEAITFNDARVIATGTIDNIDLRINTGLVGKHIAKGLYHGRATITPTDGMHVELVQANTEGGALQANGELDWKKSFQMTANLSSPNHPFDIHTAIPTEYQVYKDYAPRYLTGKLGVALGVKDKDDYGWYQFTLNQDNQVVSTNIRQKNSTKENNPNPVNIGVAWNNLYYKDFPDLGELVSPNGVATINVAEVVTISATATIHKLSALPVGEYQTTLIVNGDDLNIKHAHYQGVVGNLTATGIVHLPTSHRPLSWTINGKTSEIRPNDYFKGIGDPTRLPILAMHGRFINTGRLRQDKKGEVLELNFGHSDVLVKLENAQSVKYVGTALATLFLKDNRLSQFKADMDGQLATTGIHELLEANKLSASISGTPNKIDIGKLVLGGRAGTLSGAGKVDLADGVAWHIHARADKFHTTSLHKNAQAVVTGDVAIDGKYKNGELLTVNADIDSDILSQMVNVPSGKLTAKVSGNRNRYTIKNLKFNHGKSALLADGMVDLNDGVVGDIKANVVNFNVAQFVKRLSSDLTGNIDASFSYKKDEQSINIRGMDIKGQVNGERVLASGLFVARVDLPDNFTNYYANLKRGAKASFDIDRITGGFKDGLGAGLTQLGQRANELQNSFAKQDRAFRKLIKELKAENLTLVYGDNRVDVDGNEQKLAVNVNVTALDQFVKSLRGQVLGGLILEGDDNTLPTIYADLKISNISMPSFAMREGAILGKIVNLANKDSSLVLQGNNLVLVGKTIRKVRADLFGTQGNHDIRVALANNDLQMGVRLQGGLVGNRYSGVISEGRLQTHYGVLNQRQPSEIAYNVANGNLHLAAHCWQTLSAHSGVNSQNVGAVCLRDNLSLLPKGGHLDIAIQNLDTAVFTPVLPSDLAWRSRLNGTVLAIWGATEPVVDVALFSDNGMIGLRNEGLPDTNLPYERIGLIAKTMPEGFRIRTDIKNSGADGHLDVLINPYKDKKPIAGELKLTKFNIGVLRPFFPAVQALEGVVNVNGQVGGNLKKPLIFGQATLTNGQLRVVDVPMILTNIAANIDIRGTQLGLDGSFNSGSGQGKLIGELDWQNAVVAKIGMTGNELEINSPPLVSAKVSPDVEVLVRPSESFVDIKGIASIDKATIRPPEESKIVTEQSADVTVIDRRQSGNINAILATSAPWSINADIGVDLGNDVVFRGFGAKLPLAGALSLSQKGQGKMQARGLIQVSERTTVDAIGQNLELNYAQIRFDGDMLNPRLSIEGVRQVDGQTVGVRVTDRVASPNIQVFNDAGLSEQQAMNALVTGSLNENSGTQISEQNVRSQVTNSLAAAGLSFGLQGTRSVTNELGRALGLESLTLDASGNSTDTNVNITGYISPDLYIRYGVGVFNAQSSLSLRYQLTRRVYIEATAATENVVDAVYRWRFGDKKK